MNSNWLSNFGFLKVCKLLEILTRMSTVHGVSAETMSTCELNCPTKSAEIKTGIKTYRNKVIETIKSVNELSEPEIIVTVDCFARLQAYLLEFLICLLLGQVC